MRWVCRATATAPPAVSPVSPTFMERFEVVHGLGQMKQAVDGGLAQCGPAASVEVEHFLHAGPPFLLGAPGEGLLAGNSTISHPERSFCAHYRGLLDRTTGLLTRTQILGRRQRNRALVPGNSTIEVINDPVVFE